MVNLTKIITDIYFLKSIKSFSFGTRKKIERAIDTGTVHVICDIPVHIYYYNVKNKMIYTPHGLHTSYSNNYEGPHHPMCKIEIDRYKDYIFNEGGVKWKGMDIVFSTEDWENNDPSFYNDDMVLGVLVACFYSLSQRLKFYIHLIEDLGEIIDPGHTRAPYYTFSTINKLISLIKTPQLKLCAKTFIKEFLPINLNNIMILFKQIKNFSSDKLPERKQFILKFYHALMDGIEFHDKPPPSKPPEVSFTPKRLF